MSVWDVFESAALRSSSRTAVEVQRATSVETWTYGQLHAAALAHAGWLAACGLSAGDRCAILSDNDARWSAAYFGTLRLGAIVVPLDASCSAAQIATIVRETRPRVLFVNQRLEAIAREASIGLDVTVGVLEDVPSTPQTPVAGHDTAATFTAVILYTSGATAEPKGVVLTHAALLAGREATQAVVKMGERDNVLGALPLSNGLAQLVNLLLPLTVGARVVFLETLTSAELVRTLSGRRITIVACVPQVVNLIHQRILGEVVGRGRLARVGFHWLAGLSFRLRLAGFNLGPLLFRRIHRLLGRQMRLFVTGGARFDPATGRDLYALGFTILQAYGLTETAGATTMTTADEAHIDTVGRALPGHEIRLLHSEDPALHGEIAVRGPAVMQGYYNRPHATAAAMRDGWLLTGDLGRVDPEGRLTITGRKKDVIILDSGRKVPVEEVEARYRQSQFIREVCVLSRRHPDEPGTERLFAVVVPDMDLLRERRIANAGDLIRFEIEGQSVHLPPHQRVRGYHVWFEPLPRTTTGNLKRHEVLRRVKQNDDVASQRRLAAPNELQWEGDPHAAEAAAIIARRAKGVWVAPDSNLELDLALDSIERVELIADLERHFGVRVDNERAPAMLTVIQLIEAVRPGGERSPDVAADTSWAVLLRDLPPATDPVLGPILRTRIVVPVLLFIVLRLLRLVLPRLAPRGLQYLPASGPYIISPNHQSYLDPVFLCSALPFTVLRRLFFVGATEYFETPFMAWLARQLNLVPVDPDANLVPAMRAGAFGLTHGRILVLFPEGERSIDGTVKRFKKGAPILSRHLGVPIVPVAIHGVFELWPRNRSFNWRRLRPWSRHRVHVTFAPPMRVADDATDADAAAALRECVKAMWDDSARSPQHRAKRNRGSHAAGEQNP